MEMKLEKDTCCIFFLILLLNDNTITSFLLLPKPNWFWGHASISVNLIFPMVYY